LTPESYPILVNAVQLLLSNPDMKVEIQGHTDNIGSDSFNQKLSEQRAETVKRFLVAKGVAASRLSTVGVGPSNPVSNNKTAEGRSLNRRIEFKVLGK
ncbi:MAG: OmpA family protein, partial [Ignavibacteria bacterium]|nr:OmpA family protein [Ignavibacteria bacterium]